MVANNFDITPQQLKKHLEQGDDLILLDIREPFEYEICRLPNATLIPMGEVPIRLTELSKERPLVVYCHAGVRSARVVAWLRRQGFDNAQNLAGGIDAWSCEIDPYVPRY